jgi:hypothetical protein
MNLTVPAVVEVMEAVLETYPDHPYQQAFSHPDRRQELIAYVLTRVQNSYGVMEAGEDFSPILRSFSLEERLWVEAVVHQGIHTLFDTNSLADQQLVPEEEESGLAASHWFG